MKDSKKMILLLLLVVTIIVGALHCFNTGNLLMSDVANYENSFNYPYIFTTFSHFSLSLVFILYLFFIVRFYSLEKEYRVHMIKLYSKIQMGFGLVGLVSTILSAVLAYHSFVAPYPYKGAIVVALILNILVFVTGLLVYLYLRIKKFEDVKKPYKKKHIGRTILMSVLAFIALNRLGALFAMGWYTEWKYLYLTIWFYLTLPLPFLVLLIFILFRMRIFNKDDVDAVLAISGCLSGLSLGLCIALMIVGMREPIVISLISPAMPLERLATMPIDFIIIVLSTVVPSLITTIFEICKKFKRKKSLQAQ